MLTHVARSGSIRATDPLVCRAQWLVLGLAVVGELLQRFAAEAWMGTKQRRVGAREMPRRRDSTRERTRRIAMDTAQISLHLRRRIINQDEALDQLEEALLIAEAGLNDPHKPLAILLFVGPTGVGKTETVRALTEAIHGDVEHYCRVDMSGLNESHYAASLAGSPPGYVGSQEDETLLNRALIQGEPDKPGILLLDE